MSDHFLQNNQINIDELLRIGMNAAKSGKKEEARRILLRVIDIDQHSVTAWLWLSSVVDDPEERRTCLENILEIAPNHELAKKGLEKLGPVKKKPTLAKPPRSRTSQYKTPAAQPNSAPPVSNESEKPVHRRGPASLASALIGDQLTGRIDAPQDDTLEAEEDSAFGNEYLCPFCARQTHPNDKRCQNCAESLWVKVPRLAKASLLFRVVLILHIINLLTAPIFALIILPYLAALDRSTSLGSTLGQFTCGMGFDIFLLVALIRRWRIAFWVYLFRSGSLLCTAAVLLVLFFAVIPDIRVLIYGGIGFALALTQFFVMLSLGDDFTQEKYRVMFRVDSDAKSSLTLMEKGRKYAKRKMWGLAALHFRRAAYQMENILEPQLALAIAYNNLKMYDRMAVPLKRAHKISPNEPGVQKLMAIAAKQGISI